MRVIEYRKVFKNNFTEKGNKDEKFKKKCDDRYNGIDAGACRVRQ